MKSEQINWVVIILIILFAGSCNRIDRLESEIQQLENKLEAYGGQ